jgi:hypothetical protein
MSHSTSRGSFGCSLSAYHGMFRLTEQMEIPSNAPNSEHLPTGEGARYAILESLRLSYQAKTPVLYLQPGAEACSQHYTKSHESEGIQFGVRLLSVHIWIDRQRKGLDLFGRCASVTKKAKGLPP